MEFWGYLLFLMMGITLGLIGAGGSILTIPILIYIFKIPVILSTTYSLFIVSAASFFGIIKYKDYIVFKKGMLLAIPSLITVILTRSYILPSLPQNIGPLDRESFILILLLIMMTGAAYCMIRKKSFRALPHDLNPSTIGAVGLIGVGSGILTGLVGSGGGFLIIPTLVLLLGIRMKNAIATSLLIISLNSCVGFIFDPHHLNSDHYKKLFLFTAFALAGMWIGTHLGVRLNADLKRAFGFLIIFIAVSIAFEQWGSSFVLFVNSLLFS